ncbi:MAG: ferredoxin, partial [Bacteroidales bacterium]|nr:ferredoxin [Bacteroidales bacterium]
MIFYFSGTGNSKHVAQKLGELLGSQVKNIADYYEEVTTLKNFSIGVDKDDCLGFVSPVHSWGLS